MKVAIDATMVKDGQGGIRTVAVGVARALAESVDGRVDVITLKDDSSDWGRAAQIPSGLSSGAPEARAAWRELHLPALLRRLGSDVLLVLNPEPLHRSPIPQVIVVHDLGPLMAPAYYGRARYLRYAATISAACRKASRIASVSRSTMLDLVRWSGTPSDRIDVIGLAPQALDPSAEPSAEVAPGEGHILYVGAALPHKNLETLIRAVERSGDELPRLVMCGPDYSGEVERLMSAVTSPRVEHRGFVTRAELRALYSSAQAFAFPSLHEGFGLPILEAFMHGVPVVASDIPALRETGREHASYLGNPLDPEEWRTGLAEAVRRPHGSAQGLRDYASSFTWPHVGAEVERCLSRALVRRRS